MKTLFISILSSLLLLLSNGYSYANLDYRPIEPSSQLQLSSANPVQPTLSKKSIRQQLKAKRQAAKKQQSHQTAADATLILAVILAFLLPCVGVFVWQGGISGDFWITLLLMIFFWIPGIIYALYVIFVKG